MIVLDTNVVSEAMRPAPEPAVMAWLSAQAPTALWLTAITVAEVLFGLSQLPEGRRRDGLHGRFAALLERGFPGRVLPFDHPAADAYARVMTARRARGRPMAMADGQIAAIATCRGAEIATPDLAGFEHCGIPIVDPWTAGRKGG